MKTALIAALCVSLWVSGVAWADLDKGTYAPDIEAKQWINTESGAPVSLGEMRGMVVVLYFWVSWHVGGERLMPMVNQLENLGRRRGVYVVGLTEADRERVEEMLKEEKVLFPIGAESPSAKEYKIDSYPRVVIIDPNGKVAHCGPPSGDTIVKEIMDVIAETPPTRTNPREAVECVLYLERAREALRAGDYRAAYGFARSAYERALTGDALKTQSQDLLDLLEALGRDKLADGMRAVDEKRFEEGITTLRDVTRQFRGMASARTAQKRLKGLEERYPEVKRTLEALQREAQARGLLVTAKDALWTRSFGEAHEALQKIISEYGSTKAAPVAQTILKRMEKNQTVMAYVGEFQAAPECNNWLGQARSFIQAGNFEKAKELLRKVIDKYPYTSFAEKAYRILSEL